MVFFQATDGVQLAVQAEFRKKFANASFRDYKSWIVKEVTNANFRFTGVHLMASKEVVPATSFESTKFVGKGKLLMWKWFQLEPSNYIVSSKIPPAETTGFTIFSSSKPKSLYCTRAKNMTNLPQFMVKISPIASKQQLKALRTRLRRNFLFGCMTLVRQFLFLF